MGLSIAIYDVPSSYGWFRLASSLQDWASKRVGFAKADHSQDEEVQGAIGSPEAGRWATAATHGATPWRRLQPQRQEGSLVAGAPLSRKGTFFFFQFVQFLDFCGLLGVE